MCSIKERRIKFFSVKGSNAATFNELLMILTNEDETVMQNTCHAGHVLVETVLSLSVEIYLMTLASIWLTTMYFIGRVTLFFANNYLTEYRITMEFLHNFFKTLP